jgi:hypothetical protein
MHFALHMGAAASPTTTAVGTSV